MKRIISLLSAALLLLSLGTAAYGEESITTGEPETFEENGLTFTLPEEFNNIKGVSYPDPCGLVEEGLGYTDFPYFGISQEEYDELASKTEEELTEEDYARVLASVKVLLTVISIDQNRGVSDILNILGKDTTEEHFTEIGKVDDVTFYIMEDALPEERDTYLESLEPAYREEYSVLHDALAEALTKAEFAVPVVPGADLVGRTIEFETVDVDGNPVNSRDLFKERQITMINVWATWCGPCKGELEGLAEMNERLAEKNAAVIGVCIDAEDEKDTCKELLEENHVAYTNLLPWEKMEEELEIDCYPTSFFVDSEGTILAAPFKGAPAEMSAYEEKIDAFLAGKGN